MGLPPPAKLLFRVIKLSAIARCSDSIIVVSPVTVKLPNEPVVATTWVKLEVIVGFKPTPSEVTIILFPAPTNIVPVVVIGSLDPSKPSFSAILVTVPSDEAVAIPTRSPIVTFLVVLSVPSLNAIKSPNTGVPSAKESMSRDRLTIPDVAPPVNPELAVVVSTSVIKVVLAKFTRDCVAAYM